ncbi:MAG: 30S ribosomal protein S12 methylthiotransferase RimO [bacterium]
MPTIGLISLGCAKNTVDSEIILGLLSKADYKIIDDLEQAEILIVNTCAFINEAKQESIDTILELAGFKNEGKCKFLIVAGCLSQRYKEKLLEEIPEIDAILGTGNLLSVNELCFNLLNNNRSFPRIIVSDKVDFIYDHNPPRYRKPHSSVVYIKIAEGCNNRCSFCIIPKLRGCYRSRFIDSIVTEARQLVDDGVREINLIAQDTTYFGRDLGIKNGLVKLLEDLVEIKGNFWIRLLYANPFHISEELLDIISKKEKICNYLDIPIQHINDVLLREMKRGGTREEIQTLVKKIRTYIPDISLRTTVMVGFPGETNEQFEELMNFVEDVKFDRLGIFKYSKEEGTEVANKKVRFISEKVKEERYNRIMGLQTHISENKNLKLIGKIQKVLIDRCSGEELKPKRDLRKNEERRTKNDKQVFSVFEGRSYASAPEVDGVAYIIDELGDIKIGDFYNVKITEAFTYDVMGVKS